MKLPQKKKKNLTSNLENTCQQRHMGHRKCARLGLQKKLVDFYQSLFLLNKIYYEW